MCEIHVQKKTSLSIVSKPRGIYTVALPALNKNLLLSPQLPDGEDELAEWIQERWAEKEERLRLFYSEPDPSKRSFSDKACTGMYPRTFELWLSLAFWSVFSVSGFVVVFAYPMARFYTLMIVLFYVTAIVAFGGIDKVEMLFYEQFFKPSSLWGKARGAGSDSLGGGDGLSNPYDKYLN